jgi:hypothetical protein
MTLKASLPAPETVTGTRLAVVVAAGVGTAPVLKTDREQVVQAAA